MLSIVIPVYNAESTLADTIKCVLRQSFTDYELILIDDGSTDSSFSICKHYGASDNRIKIVHKENEGASAARNNGIEIASHEYITFIDADDSISDNYLQCLVDDLRKNDCPDLLIQGLSQKWPHFSKDFLLKDKHYNLYQGEAPEFFKDVYLNDFSGPYCKLYRRSIIDSQSLRFSKDIIYAEDLDFTLRYLPHCNSVATSSKANYSYLMHSGSVSSKIYSFEKELKGLRQLYSSYSSLSSVFHSSHLLNMMKKSICDYFWRIIYSNYRNNYNRKTRIMNLNALSIEELTFFNDSYFPATLFTRLVRNLLVNRKMILLDMILKFRLQVSKY